MYITINTYSIICTAADDRTHLLLHMIYLI